MTVWISFSKLLHCTQLGGDLFHRTSICGYSVCLGLSGVMLVLEEQRYIHEDLERLEQGIADRIRDEPKHVRIYV
jgi:hypothetical protein